MKMLSVLLALNLRGKTRDSLLEIDWPFVTDWLFVTGIHRSPVDGLPMQMDCNAELWGFLYRKLEQTIVPIVELSVFWIAMAPMWCHCNETRSSFG